MNLTTKVIIKLLGTFCLSSGFFGFYFLTSREVSDFQLIDLEIINFLSIILSIGSGIFLLFAPKKSLKEFLLSKMLLFLFLSKMILGICRQVYAYDLTISSYGWMTMYFSAIVFIIWYRMEVKKEDINLRVKNTRAS